MQRVRPALGALACVGLLVASCSSDPASDAQEAPVHLADDAVTITEGPIYDSSSAATTTMAVSDLTRDGNRLLLLLANGFKGATTTTFDPGCTDCSGNVGNAGGGVSFDVFVSDDLGATWKHTDFAFDDWQGTRPLGLHASGGRVIVQGAGSRIGIGGDSYGFVTLRELDLATGMYVPNPATDMKQFFRAPFQGRGAHLVSTAPPESTKGIDITTYDLSTRQLTVVVASLPGGNALCNNWATSLDGAEVETYCSTTSPENTCETILDATTGTGTPRCVSTGLWPERAAGGPTITSRGLVLRSGAEGPLVGDSITAVNAAGKLDVLSLGTSTTSTAATVLGGGVEHFRFGALLPHTDALLDITGAGVQRIAVPSPCRDEQCGVERRLDFLVPLDDGRQLGFFVVNSRLPDPGQGPAYHGHLYVRPVTLTSAGSDGGVPTVPPVLAGYPGAVPGAPLQAACLAANGCFQAQDLTACMAYWSSLPEGNAARVAFLAAANQGCAALKSAWPEQALRYGFAGCTLGCLDDHTLISSCGNQATATPAKVYDCRRVGTKCGTVPGSNTPTCIDGLGTTACQVCVGTIAESCGAAPGAADCAALGESCAVIGGLAQCKLGCAGPDHCEGDAAIFCSAAQGVSRLDCADYAGVCVVTAAGVPSCGPKVPPPGGQPCSGISQKCVGTFALTCGAGGITYTDCASIGLSTCDLSNGSLACK